MKTRARLEFEGIVQGVGFRPFLHRLAAELGLAGWVLNTSAGVLLEIEGAPADVGAFIERVPLEAPALSRILVTRVRRLPPLGYHEFAIHPSRLEAGALTLLCPDVAVCPDCLREMWDHADRRYRYPFINCTNCGPRYTIVRSLPYDRPATVMSSFPLCPDCLAEYEDPRNRRYHAQPVACPVCGPRLWFAATNGAELEGDALAHATAVLQAGGSLAIKGLGGFHLACRADSNEVVLRLRRRKGRTFFKPLALMLRDLEMAATICELNGETVEWLQSAASPIVLSPLRQGAPGPRISRYVAPNLDRLGIMLPYTPLHHLLMAALDVPLVMTSGNLSEQPVLGDNAAAVHELGPLCDGFLLHDRPIHARCDDSVLSAGEGECIMFRHSRGFCPFPLALPQPGPSVLALGGDIKTTFAASRGQFAFLSPHLGDASHIANYVFFRDTWEHYRKLFGLQPEAVACDQHPGYYSARWAAELAEELGVPLIKVQHHHAHLAALLTEHGLEGTFPALVADGTGYGADGTIWGGEVLLGNERECRRIAHLRPVMLPGGDAAAEEPWRIALALLHQAAPELEEDYARRLLDGSLWAATEEQLTGWIGAGNDPSYAPPTGDEVALIRGMLRSGTSFVASTALGRLFDGITALLGINLHATYEGQPPMECEALLSSLPDPGPDCLDPRMVGEEGDVIDWAPLVRLMAGEPGGVALWAWRFHYWCAYAFGVILAGHPALREAPRVLASGGCLQNATFRRLLARYLGERGKELLTHKDVPPGDGGLSLGVLRVALARMM